MKKITSLLLAVLMLFSVVAVGAVSVSAEDDVIAFKAGSLIYFDNTNTQWEDVYFYAWAYGYFGDFVPMEKVEGKDNLYSVVVPVDVPDGAEYFLFTNSTTWKGQQTPNQPVLAGENTYTPVLNSTGNISYVRLSSTDLPVKAEVTATPYSKSFTETLDVTIYAFNLAGGEKSTYSLNGADPVEFTDTETFTLTTTTKITVTAGSTSKTFNYTKVGDAVITVFAEYESGDAYTGDIYVWTFGGDRVGSEFNKMILVDEKEGEYTYSINGSAQVIFTTTNDWNTAVKFTICDGNTGAPLSDQEPLVSAGQEVEYTLKIADPVTEE